MQALDEELIRQLTQGGQETEATFNAPDDAEIESWVDNSITEFFGLFMAVAWAVAIYYLLSCLHTDRKDKSVFFWKSLPISETQNVLAKLAFGSLGFVSVAIVIAWVTYFVFLVMGFGTISSVNLGLSTGQLFGAISFVKLFIYPIVSLVVGVLWAAPVFAYIAFCSASSKRSPFLRCIIPILALALIEYIVFRSSGFLDWVASHMPFAIIGEVFSAGSLGAYFAQLMDEQGGQLVFGLIVATILTVAAIWYRNHRFEI